MHNARRLVDYICTACSGSTYNGGREEGIKGGGEEESWQGVR